MAASQPLRVIALLAAYNEEDVIAQVVADLIAQGLHVYFIDHASTDGTRAEVEPFVGRGVVGIERYPDDAGLPAIERDRYAWEQMVARKEQLSRELDGDWFLHTDADELRESPWLDRNLLQGIEAVDRLGYNAIDFQVFNFRPTHDDFKKGDDLRAAFPYWEPGEVYDAWQVKCWKKTPDIDLARWGGHDARFAGRRVFPVRFVLRHYPIRSQAHGTRKVFGERKPRFVDEERQKGWHVQYDAIEDGHQFVRDAKSLVRFDPDAIRVDLWLKHRAAQEWETRARDAEEDLADAQKQLADARVALPAYQHEQDRLNAENEMLRAQVTERQRALDAWAGELEHLRADTEARTRELGELRLDREARAREVAQLREERDDLVRQRDAGQRHALELERERDQARAAYNEREHERDVAAAEMTRARDERDQAYAQRDAAHHYALDLERERDQARAAYDERVTERDEIAAAMERARGEAKELAATAAELRDALARAAVAHDELARVRDELARAADALARAGTDLARTSDEAARARHELAQVQAHLSGAEARLDEFYGSRTWRWTAAARVAWRLIGRE
jgi:Glycosyl transferase family 2